MAAAIILVVKTLIDCLIRIASVMKTRLFKDQDQNCSLSSGYLLTKTGLQDYITASLRIKLLEQLQKLQNNHISYKSSAILQMDNQSVN